MPRRRTAPRVARGQTTVSLVQIAMLALLLVGLLLFRDKISAGAGNFFSAFTTPADLKAPPPAPEQQRAPSPAPQ